MIQKNFAASEADFQLESYDFPLQPEQIAQFPCAERGASRLMVLRGEHAPLHAAFADLPELLPPHSLLVANNSRVMRARLAGTRPGGGKAEFLLLAPPPLLKVEKDAGGRNTAVAAGLVRPAAKIRIGQILRFAEGIAAEILQKGQFGQCVARLRWHGDLVEAIENAGRLPLPPYIRREPERLDASRYQTVYAASPGSVAAPTAGLHFTEAMRRRLLARGHEWLNLSLHVGYGTFSPVRGSDIRLHEMHAEYVEISAAAANSVARASAEKRPIICVGTTSLRALEGVFRARGRVEAYAGLVNIFLYPGQKINVVDGLLTNFHLPRSTLLMLVSALAGRERVLAAYNEAARAGYRFFSYGDAMLLL